MTEPKAVSKVEDRAERLLAIAGDDPLLKAQAFQAMTAYKQSQLITQGAAAIAELSWGVNLSPMMRGEVARYALEQGTDPVRHWEVLGGRLYDRAELWLDLVTAQVDFEGFTKKFLHDDERLDDGQRAERMALRAEHGVPEGMAGACLVTIYRSSHMPSEGVNWAGSHGNKKDPVGDAEPTKTAFTRASRKAAKTCYPLWFRRHRKAELEGVEIARFSREGVEERLESERQVRKAMVPVAPPTHQLGAGVALSGGGKQGYPAVSDDPYSEEPNLLDLTDDEIRRQDAELAE